ncbi:pullulanase-associated domain-containing protein [Niveibacterium sp.]|uniref:pullulanase-associated domain-containing protein n=1 Tax=Niveibacterium sp. TaxID=2017444 RepID=UPI0035B2C2A6
MTTKRFFLKAVTALALGVAAMPIFAADASDPAEGEIAINYFRPDGNYAGWGLHAWIGNPGQPGTPIDGVDWFGPLKPKGKTDDAGVYWHVPLSAFGKSGFVNYIIHKGDTKEQGGKDQRFDGNTIKQIWVNAGDKAIYTSKEEAIKARQAK